MDIYRLEHRSSFLGPFEHHASGRKPTQDVLRYLYTCSREFMRDLTQDEVKSILTEHPKSVFGWSTIENCLKMIKDLDSVKSFGFRIRVFQTEPLYVSVCGQVIFTRPLTFKAYSAE